jgi:hypothetical protein
VNSISMVQQSARIICLLCLATFAGVSRAGEGSESVASIQSAAYKTVIREARGGEDAWPETTRMALFGAGLSYVGLRLVRRKA